MNSGMNSGIILQDRNINNNIYNSSSNGPHHLPPQIINNYFGTSPSSSPHHYRNHRNNGDDDYSCLRPVYMPIGCNGISSQIVGYVETPCQDPEERILTLPTSPYRRNYSRFLNPNFIRDFPTIYENVCPSSCPRGDCCTYGNTCSYTNSCPDSCPVTYPDSCTDEVPCPNVCPVYYPRNRYNQFRYR
jgi:hypothetical protein